MEIERKFLIPVLPDLTKSQRASKIIQAYISESPEIRIRNIDGVCYITQKSDGTLIRQETETEISRNAFDEKLNDAIGHIINKTRYYFNLENNLTAELDIYDSELKGLCAAEVEFKNEDEAKNFIPPDWFGTEVTYDKRYKNKMLAIYGLSE